MKIFAKIGTGPQRQVIVDGRRFNSAIKKFERGESLPYIKFKDLAAGSKWQGGLIRGLAGDSLMIERW